LRKGPNTGNQDYFLISGRNFHCKRGGVMKALIDKNSSPGRSRRTAQPPNVKLRSKPSRAVSFLLLLAVLLFSFPIPGSAQVVVPVPVFNDPVLDVFVPEPLSNVPVPEPVNLAEYVLDKAAAIQLGKALFWDMSVGSDGKVACATCHHHAGVDSRSKNTLNPTKMGGAVDPIDALPGGPNYQLDPGDFPFVNFIDTANRFSLKIRNVHDVIGSQGVTLSTFNATVPGQIVDDKTSVPDGLFNVGGNNTRRTTGRNTPTAINAVHNLRNFHDGRAAMSFNGTSPFGVHDSAVKIFTSDPLVNGGLPTPTPVFLALSSLASQATGPPGDSTEMSAAGRTWPDIGRKMVAMQALTQQIVDPTDSVLGPLAMAGTGLRQLADPATALTYGEMIAAAFQPQFVDDVQTVDIDGNPLTLDDIYTMTQVNFSLFFGLAVQLYEATLVSDDALFDRVLRGDINPDTTQPFAFNPNEKRGLEIFTNVGQNPNPAIPRTFCVACHIGAEFTAASVGQLGRPVAAPEAPEFAVERMPSGLIEALGTLVFSTNPLPDQLPFPAGFEDPLLSPLNGGTVTVLPSIGSTGAGTFTTPIGNALTLLGQVTDLVLAPVPVLPGDPEVAVTIEVTVDGDITFELGTIGLPDGLYDVLVDGILLGTIEIIPNILYDLGFYNIGVTPSLDDLAIGADPGPNPDLHPLSFSLQHILGVPADHILAGAPVVLDPITGLPLELPPVIPGETPLINGAFKVPGLRNVDLTAPYFHNGGKRTLCEVLDFYSRGGDFHELNILDLDPDIGALGFTEQDKIDLAAFVKTLTDDRVRFKRGPFDHPQLLIPNGHVGDHLATIATVPGISDDIMLELAAVGAAGGPAIDSVGFLGGGVGACDREIIDVQVSASSDDAEERASNGQISTTSPDLDMTDGGSFEHINGIRFNGVNIPVGATITNAYVQFQADASTAGASILNVQGELNVNPLTFTTANSNISSRTRTAAAVPWAPVPWTVGDAGPEQRTADITTIVQEIIGLGGWASGNSLAVIIDGLGTHAAESFDGLPAGAPSLHVEFTTGPPPAPVVVPNVVAMLQTPATIALGNAGLMLGTVTNQTDASPVGTVLSQNPVNPTPVPPGTPVDLVVSSGPPPPPVVVPNVVGLLQGPATTAITGATLTLGVVTFQTDAAVAGTVIIQNPVNPTLVPPGTPVAIVVSSGPPPPPVVVPNVVGQQQAVATTNITNATLALGAVTFQTSAAPVGEVLSQNPANPTPVPPGTPVDLVVSSGLAPSIVDVQVSASSDDAEERDTTGAISTTSPDLDMTDGGAFEHINGIRFNGVAIPVGATITSAYVQFQADASNGAPSALNVQGELNANPLTFTTANSNISSRTRTAAAVPWAPVPWTVGDAGPVQRTADITSIVQEIIGLGGWASGNSMAILIDGLGTHAAESFDGTPAGAPVLHVEFTTGPPPPPVVVPDVVGLLQGAAETAITGATLTVGTVTPQSDAAPIGTVLSQNPTNPTAVPPGTPVDLVVSSGPPPPPVVVPNVVGLLQGPATTAITGATLTLGTVTFQTDPAPAGEVLSQNPTNPTAVPPGTPVDLVVSSGLLPTMLDIQVSASSDDAEERVANGQISTTSPDLDMSDGGSFEHIVGMRFNGVAIPVGATITNAYVQFQVDATTGAPSALNVQGELNANPLTFTTANSNISSRTRTATAVPWAAVPWNAIGDAGPDQRTANITAIVQEIIGLGGWASGNSMAIIIDGLGTHEAEAFDGTPAGAPVLHVEFTTGGAP
jgi:beta-lactam-binding protein with PASTA domain/cytochrome c peroxidase